MTPSSTPNRVKNAKLLLSAYACQPQRGSEPGVGWNMAQELVKHCAEVWVLTRTENRPPIEAALATTPVPRLHFVYYDLPKWLVWWKKGDRGLRLHYYLWQVTVYSLAKQLHHEVGFDLVHHLTYSRYCVPSSLVRLPVPFIWGPLGGGEAAPRSFRQNFSLTGKLFETFRDLSCWMGERDPWVQLTGRRCALALAVTKETLLRLPRLGVKRIETVLSSNGIQDHELAQFQTLARSSMNRPVRFISMGRLLHWKGFDLGLRAFAQANLIESEFWIVGEGAEQKSLMKLAQKLGIADRVIFLGTLSRGEALAALGACDVLVHPALHDFSPAVCLEAMAAGRPVICLDLGGAAGQVTAETGVKVGAMSHELAVRGIAEAMKNLYGDQELRERMGTAARQRVSALFRWTVRGVQLVELYEEVLRGHN